MKYILYIIFILIIASLSYGYYIKTDEELVSHKFIGAAVLGFFFIWMPLFLYHRSKNNDIKKYMITDKTIKKIKDEAESFLD